MRGVKLIDRPQGKKKKLKVGRPVGGAYKPEYPKLLIDHMSKGYSYKSFAGVAGVCQDTLYDWEKRHPEWQNAKTLAFGKSRMWWEEKAIDAIESGKPLNTGLWIVNMKMRFKDTLEAFAPDRTVVQVRNETNIHPESEQKLVQEFKDVMVSYRDERKGES